MTTASSVWPRNPETTVRAEQNEDQRVLELGGERAPGGLARERLQLVRAMDLKALAPPRRSTARAKPWRGGRSRPRRIPCARSASVRDVSAAARAGGAGGADGQRRHHAHPAAAAIAMHQSIDWTTSRPSVALQPCPFTVNAAALDRGPSQREHQQDRDRPVQRRQRTTARRSSRSFLASLRTNVSAGPARLRTRLQAKKKARSSHHGLLTARAKVSPVPGEPDRTVRVPRSLDDSAARAAPRSYSPSRSQQ